MLVPNKFPTIHSQKHRLAIVGEAPGRDEEIAGEPFMGVSGRFLAALLSKTGLSREACFLGNICQYRPPANEISAFRWEGDEIQEGLAQLRLDLQTFKPNLVLCLGNSALKAAMDVTAPFRNGKSRYNQSVFDWRGSMITPKQIESPMFGLKCMGSYHPAYVLRDYSVAQVLQLDLKRAVAQATFPELRLPVRDLILPKNAGEVCSLLQDIQLRKPRITIDIEGYVFDMTMISVADSKNRGFIVPFAGPNAGHFYPTVDDETAVWHALSQILADKDIPKALQNGLYDWFVMQYGDSMVVRGVTDDTMLKHWEMFCELEKSLGFQASIYTLEPYYKSERKADSWEMKYKYCIKDSCVTHEINNVLEPALPPASKEHYRFNMALLEPLMFMELKGIRYDAPQALIEAEQCKEMLYGIKHKLDEIAACGLPQWNHDSVFIVAKDLMCFKKAQGIVTSWDHFATWTKKDYTETWKRVRDLAMLPTPWSDSVKGELSSLLDVDMNVGSPRFRDYIYDVLNLPLQTNDEGSPTADYGALLNIWKKTSHPVADLAIQIRELQTRIQMLQIKCDPDGRVRTGYNLVGSETGRVTSSTSPTGSGYNLQTMPKENELRPKDHPLHRGMRHLFLADDGYDFAEFDLSGADGYTIAPYCKMLGDSTMLDDYRAGLKPAKILALLLRHGATINTLSRDELRKKCKEIEKDSWEYFACKQGIWGSCYLMGEIKLAKQIFIVSEGLVKLTTSQVHTLQSLLFMRYWGVKKLHAYTTNRLNVKNVPTLTAPSGHRRMFFGRAREILGEALAHEPQANTTYATNSAAKKLWLDPENKTSNGGLYIEPLHQVHDALVVQWPKERRAWAIEKMKSYFQNTLTIAQQEITIPFEGSYGESWGRLTNSIDI